MPPPRPKKPCPHCSSTRFAQVPAVIVLSPFMSVVTRNAPVPWSKRVDKRENRSGEALVCLGCGHVETFMQSFDSVLQQPGVIEVHVDDEGPYR